MKAAEAAQWMLERLSKEGCLYQEDAVDHLVRAKAEGLLKENADGNVVLSSKLLAVFRELTGVDVVWVRPDRYWRYRVKEDEEGRDQRG